MANDTTKTKLKLEPHQIILRPLVTEKGYHKAERLNSYTFEVNRMAGKDDIRADRRAAFRRQGRACQHAKPKR